VLINNLKSYLQRSQISTIWGFLTSLQSAICLILQSDELLCIYVGKVSILYHISQHMGATIIAESTLQRDHVIVDMSRQTRDLMSTWFDTQDEYTAERITSILMASKQSKQTAEVYTTPAELFTTRES
jgi:hypothetical protein